MSPRIATHFPTIRCPGLSKRKVIAVIRNANCSGAGVTTWLLKMCNMLTVTNNVFDKKILVQKRYKSYETSKIGSAKNNKIALCFQLCFPFQNSGM